MFKKLLSNKTFKLVYKLIIILILFSFILYFFDSTHFVGLDPEDEKIPTKRFFNRLYFITGTFATTGYGDITPASVATRSLIMLLQVAIIINILDKITL